MVNGNNFGKLCFNFVVVINFVFVYCLYLMCYLKVEVIKIWVEKNIGYIKSWYFYFLLYGLLR